MSVRARAAIALLSFVVACSGDDAPTGDPAQAPARERSQDPNVFEVEPGGDIQAAIETAAAAGAKGKTVRVRAGTYRPKQPAQALIWFHAKHDGITVEADGAVVLTAANPGLADPSDPSFPAIVNHVVYFGDGVGASTVLRGFEITGANHYVTQSETPGPVQPNVPEPRLTKSLFFYCDGGAIKVFGRSSPTLERLDVHDNYASPCAGGLSIEQRGFSENAVTIRDCVFRNNRCQITGSAVDVLPGGAAELENCLFVGNVSNTGVDFVSPKDDLRSFEHGSGALTVFSKSRARVVRCTFTDNWNGADDTGEASVYEHCLFWKNGRGGGVAPGTRYELDVVNGAGVTGCRIGGGVADLRGTIDKTRNTLDAPDPEFDAAFEPRAPGCEGVGYRAPRAAK